MIRNLLWPTAVIGRSPPNYNDEMEKLLGLLLDFNTGLPISEDDPLPPAIEENDLTASLLDVLEDEELEDVEHYVIVVQRKEGLVQFACGPNTSPAQLHFMLVATSNMLLP